MPKLHRAIAVITTLAMSATLTACSGGAIATVNGQAISKSDLDNKLESSPAAKSTLQQMVQEIALDQYAKNNNITVTDDEIAKKEDEIKANFPNGSWSDMLKQRGLTEADVSNLLRQQILIDKAVGKDIKIDDAQIKAYFDKNHAAFDKPDQVRARHILIPNGPTALATALKVEALLKAPGADWNAIAKQYSSDPGSKDKGGELGFFRKGQMVPAFEKVAFSEPVNAISAPVKSPFGYHIIQVEERQVGEKATLASAHDKIAELLRQQQEQPAIQPFMQKLMADAKYQSSDPRFADLFPTPPPAIAPSASSAATPAPAGS